MLNEKLWKQLIVSTLFLTWHGKSLHKCQTFKNRSKINTASFPKVYLRSNLAVNHKKWKQICIIDRIVHSKRFLDLHIHGSLNRRYLALRGEKGLMCRLSDARDIFEKRRYVVYCQQSAESKNLFQIPENLAVILGRIAEHFDVKKLMPRTADTFWTLPTFWWPCIYLATLFSKQ